MPPSLDEIRRMGESMVSTMFSDWACVMPAPPLAFKSCECCRATDDDGMHNLSLCSACRRVWYCSSECSRKYWSNHRTMCKDIVEARRLNEEAMLSKPRESLLRTKLDDFINLEFASEIAYCFWNAHKIGTGHHPELIDVPHILVLEFECDEKLADKPLRTQFKLLNGRLLPTEDYVQEHVRSSRGHALHSRMTEAFRSAYRPQIPTDPDYNRLRKEEPGSYGVACVANITVRWKGDLLPVSRRMDMPFEGVLVQANGAGLKRHIFELNWLDYIQRSLKNPKARSFNDVWYGRIDEFKAQQAAESIKRGEKPVVSDEGSVGAVISREMRRLGPFGGVVSYNPVSGVVLTTPVTADGTMCRDLGTPEEESVLRKAVRKARKAEKKKAKKQAKKAME